MSISITGRAIGVSPYINITSEEMTLTLFHDLTDVKVEEGMPVPPSVADGAACSTAMFMWISGWPQWLCGKITEPKFDGIASSLGAISNKPDLISEQHFISIMRTVDTYLAPAYGSRIYASTNMPAPITPPTP